MNCDRALLALLDAELPELTTTSTTPLALHVLSCPRCRRVADRFTTDTHLLAMAMPTSGSRPGKSLSSHRMAPLAVAAALLVMVAVQRQGVTPVTAGTVVLPPVVIGPAAPAGSLEPDAASPARPRVARKFPPAAPVAAVRLVGSQSVIAEPLVTIPTRTVSVTPPAGTRAVVMQTSDPKLVVVWLY